MSMDAGAVTRKLLLAVSPVLLADVLARALRFEGLDVVLYSAGEDHGAFEPRQFDLALVSGDLPGDVAADVVLRLPETADLPDLVQLVGTTLDGSAAIG